ncbi:MAG TPA: hypothetical protein VHI76_06495 [Solirubrobacterales bacterium]|jgi:hypothetical protein|nr:hypothetical protein [Solirubrobacterales bacterium]
MTRASDRIELVRRGTELFNRRELEELLRILAAGPDFEWDTRRLGRAA